MESESLNTLNRSNSFSTISLNDSAEEVTTSCSKHILAFRNKVQGLASSFFFSLAYTKQVTVEKARSFAEFAGERATQVNRALANLPCWNSTTQNPSAIQQSNLDPRPSFRSMTSSQPTSSSEGI